MAAEVKFSVIVRGREDSQRVSHGDFGERRDFGIHYVHDRNASHRDGHRPSSFCARERELLHAI